MFTLKPSKSLFDWWLLLVVIFLSLFGLVMIYNASVVEAMRDFGNKYYYLKNQTVWLVIGIVGFAFFSLFNYRHLEKIAPLLFFINILLLILVLVPGVGVKVLGARRRIDFGFFAFQPAEMVKLTLVLYLSSWLKEKRHILPFLGLIVGILGLIILEPDLGTAVVVISTAFALYFVAESSWFKSLFLVILMIAGFLFLSFSSPYRRERFLTFLDPTQDPLGSSYHIRQILIALGSGGLWGKGAGHSRQKYEYLPEATTDSIFAIIAEETGFLGSLMLILAFLFFSLRGFTIAQNAPCLFSRLIAIGITFWLSFQVLINLSAMVALIPLTGIPLPFISYGGSALVVSLAGVGILLNISKFQVKRVK